MKNLKTKIKRIEDAVKPKGGVTVFPVRYGHEEEDFKKQHKDYIANGGNQDDIFVSLTNYAGIKINEECKKPN